MNAYWDTSCLLKLYCLESDSETYLLKIQNCRQPPKSSALVRVELFYAFQQKFVRGETGGRSASELFADFESDVQLGRIQLLPFADDVALEARKIAHLCYQASPPILLRSLDGIHLATATLGACGRILSTDVRMNAAAAFLSAMEPG